MHQLWRTWNIIVNKVEFCNFSILFRSMMVVKLANLVSLKMEVCRSAWILAFGQVAGRSLIICVIIYILCILYWKGAFILLTVGATQHNPTHIFWAPCSLRCENTPSIFGSSALHMVRLRWSAATMARPCTKCSCPENFWSCQLIWDSDLEPWVCNDN